MTLRLSLIEDDGIERLAISRRVKGMPHVALDTIFRANCALLVGEAEDLVKAGGILEDVIQR